MRRAYLGWIVFFGTIAIGIALVCITTRAQARGCDAFRSAIMGDHMEQGISVG